ncbi:MAG: hypothetical protein M0D57_21335 [Sphingobacteriales bacterium JAD_PAG50586_3]|nr:MAG: hypothetical protein M0D57_21335 [Sphingobacteriales bacterium JAD_PAG50586_3]
MNNTAYNSLKKLFLMSLVLFAGAAFAQSNNNAELLGTTKPGVTSKPVTQGTSEAKPDTKFNTSAAPDATAPAATQGRVRPTHNAKASTTSNTVSDATNVGYINERIAKLNARLPGVKGTAEEADILKQIDYLENLRKSYEK